MVTGKWVGHSGDWEMVGYSGDWEVCGSLW